MQGILQKFIDTPIPSEETLQALKEGLFGVLEQLGLGSALDALKSGEYGKFFGMTGSTASYVGAALVAIGFLKECFDNDADKSVLTNIENEIKGDKDLLNFKLPLDFDFAILKNIQDCVDLTALAAFLKTKELLCDALKTGADLAEGMWDKVLAQLQEPGAETDSAATSDVSNIA
jgi:hypothetical protein